MAKKRKKSKKKLGQTGVKHVPSMDAVKIPKQMCKRAVYLLDSTLEDYKRGRVEFSKFQAEYDTMQRLNIPVHCKKTGKKIKRTRPQTGHTRSIYQIKCFCYPPGKKLSGRGVR